MMIASRYPSFFLGNLLISGADTLGMFKPTCFLLGILCTRYSSKRTWGEVHTTVNIECVRRRELETRTWQELETRTWDKNLRWDLERELETRTWGEVHTTVNIAWRMRLLECVYLKCVYLKCVYLKCVYLSASTWSASTWSASTWVCLPEVRLLECIYLKCICLKCVCLKLRTCRSLEHEGKYERQYNLKSASADD